MSKFVAALIVALTIALAVVIAPSPAPQPSAPWNRSSTITPSAWDKPALVNPTTIEITDTTRNLTLASGTDYILKCDNTGPLTWGLVVYGGHNVVLEDCIYDQGATFAGAAQFKNQTGTLWVHDVHFKGSNLEEGIDLQEPNPGVRVVLRDVLVDPVYDEGSNHADVIQTWCGPATFLVDGLTGQTNYQGFFLLPNQNGGCGTTTPTTYDLRHVDITGITAFGRSAATLGWAGWFGTQGADVGWHLDHVYFGGESPVQFWPNPRQWADATAGTPAGGSYVTAASWGATGADESNSGTSGSNQQGAYGAGESPLALLGEQQ